MIERFYTATDGTLRPTTTLQKNCWLHVEAPTPAEVESLVDHFSVPRDYLTAVLDDRENPRAEGIDQATDEKPALILLHFPHETISPLGYRELTTYPFAIILTPQALITVTNRPALFVQDFIVRKAYHVNTNEHENFALHLLWYICHSYVSYLEQIGSEMAHLEKSLSVASGNNELYQLTAMQKSLIQFQIALKRNQHLLNELQTTNFYFESDPFSELLQDVMIESDQAQTMTFRQKSILDEYNNMVSSVVSNNLNIIMKVLTSITIILTIPTIIGGIYGMNVKLPGAAFAHAFSLIMLITLIICWLSGYWLRKRNFF
ncbi:magnesium transporter CorA family protein [Loigolactobacillus iwatensis]|uniref:magnesium transporter CorA family protein n=1 Tax=Loigolactobacillus iwatensis TaxID=1267156 RepID=UPI000F7DCB27|nr:magnesium transporter CorA family protein [Loigolactobacillus iwatensis]